MAEIAEGGGGGHGKGKKRAKKSSTRVDMTPLVDLAFLLLTFFVLTSTFSKPKVMSLVYPAKPDNTTDKQETEVNEAITFLLSDNKVFYYEGKFLEAPEDGKPATELTETDFGSGGLRKLLADKNYYVLGEKAKLDKKLEAGQLSDTTHTRLVKEAKGSVKALTVLIKTDEVATCKNFIDLVDELKIADIARIAPVDMTKSEQELLKAKTGK